MAAPGKALLVSTHPLRCVALASTLVVAPASATPLTAALAVERAPEALDCPDRAELERRVEEILQRPLADGSAGGDQIRVEVEFRRGRDGYLAELRFLGPKPGERALRDRGPGCGPLAEAVSVAIGLVLDRELHSSRSSEASPDSRRPPATIRSQPDEATKLQSSQGAPELRGSLGGGLVVGLGDVASPLATGDLELRVRGRWILGAGFDILPPSTTRFGVGEVRTSLLVGNLRGCAVFGDRFFLGPCALFGIGRLHGVGVGYDQVQSDSLLWSAAGAGIVAEAPVWGQVFWGVSADVWVPLRRQTFSVQNAGTAWESSPVVASLALRVGIRAWWNSSRPASPTRAREASE